MRGARWISLVVVAAMAACSGDQDARDAGDVGEGDSIEASADHGGQLGSGVDLAEAYRLAGVNPADTVVPSAAVADSTVVAKLMTADSLEVETGRMGAERGTDAGVKQLGQMLQAEHGKSRQDVQAMAQRLSLAPKPDRADTARAHHQKTSQKLSGLQGMDFDTLYAHEGVRHHAHTLAQLKGAAAMASNQELRAFLESNVIPMIQRHLEQAARLTTSLAGGPGAAAMGDTMRGGMPDTSGAMGGSRPADSTKVR